MLELCVVTKSILSWMWDRWVGMDGWVLSDRAGGLVEAGEAKLSLIEEQQKDEKKESNT